MFHFSLLRMIARRAYYLRHVGNHLVTRNTIFAAVTREAAEGKGFLATTFLFFSSSKKYEKLAILHTRLQLVWIESVLAHSFLACNLLWSYSLVETSDTELRSRKGLRISDVNK